MMQKTVVCLPTYNEAQNIGHVVKTVLDILPQAHILVIDDNSSDGTGDIADRLASQDDRITVLHRHCKLGLGKAYCHGFRVAIDHFAAQRIIQMDADLSHPAERLPAMMDAAENADLVLGSRYVPAGCTKNWSMLRQAISRFGSVYSRMLLNLPVCDPTAGFKLWQRDLLERVIDRPISSGGYVFQVETTFYAYIMGAKIAEVPICFAERGLGQSKMTFSIAFEAFWRVPMIRFGKSKRRSTH